MRQPTDAVLTRLLTTSMPSRAVVAPPLVIAFRIGALVALYDQAGVEKAPDGRVHATHPWRSLLIPVVSVPGVVLALNLGTRFLGWAP